MVRSKWGLLQRHYITGEKLTREKLGEVSYGVPSWYDQWGYLVSYSLIDYFVFSQKDPIHLIYKNLGEVSSWRKVLEIERSAYRKFSLESPVRGSDVPQTRWMPHITSYNYQVGMHSYILGDLLGQLVYDRLFKDGNSVRENGRRLLNGVYSKSANIDFEQAMRNLLNDPNFDLVREIERYQP